MNLASFQEYRPQVTDALLSTQHLIVGVNGRLQFHITVFSKVSSRFQKMESTNRPVPVRDPGLLEMLAHNPEHRRLWGLA